MAEAIPESVEFDFDDNGLIETNNSRILHSTEQLKDLKVDSTKEGEISDGLKPNTNLLDDIEPGQNKGDRKKKKKNKKKKKGHGGVAAERLEADVHKGSTAGDNGTTKGISQPDMKDGNISKETDKGGGNLALHVDGRDGNMCKETDYGPGNLEPDMKDGQILKETDYGPGNLEPDRRVGNILEQTDKGTGNSESPTRNDDSIKETNDRAGKLAPDTRYGNDFGKTNQATGNVELDVGNVFEIKGFSPTVAHQESDSNSNFKDTPHKVERWKSETRNMRREFSSNIINRNGKSESCTEVEGIGYVEETYKLATDRAKQYRGKSYVPTNFSNMKRKFEEADDKKTCVSSLGSHCPVTGKRNREKTSLSQRLWEKLTYFLFLLLMSGAVVKGALNTVPDNTVVYRGQTARLTCSTGANQHVYWMRILSGSGTQQWLYYGEKGLNVIYDDGRFSIDRSNPGSQDLVIAAVQPTDAGNYICMDESGVGQRAAAELIVIGSMNCDDTALSNGVMASNIFSIKHDNIQLTCNLTYKGNIVPSLIWSWPGDEQQREKLTIIETSNSVLSTLKLAPTKELGGITFTCQATLIGAANRQKDRRLTWESKPVFAGYADFEEREVPECPGISLNLICNPACSYTFAETENSRCKCQYTYRWRLTDQVYSATSKNVLCTKKPTNRISMTTSAILIVTILIPLTACLGVLLALLIRKLKRSREKHNEPCINDCNSSSSEHSNTSDNLLEHLPIEKDNPDAVWPC